MSACTIIDRLINRITELSAPIVVGLDPRLDQIPSYIKNEAHNNNSDTLQATAEAITAFNKTIIDQIYDIVPAVKPQIAMYEQFGPLGMHAYLSTIDYAKSKGLIVIGDIKRNDIGATAKAYSNVHIGRVQINSKELEIAQTDFITVNPYMGLDSIEPFFADCKKYDKGLFILVKTSNKGSRDIQDLPMANGNPLYTHVGDLVENWGQDFIGSHGYSTIGAVVGATHPPEAVALRKAMPNTFFLVPGYGAQGGSGKDLKNLWTKNYGAIVNNAREITGAYLTPNYKCADKDFALASRQAVLDMKADLTNYISI